jgi:hypothetical protein
MLYRSIVLVYLITQSLTSLDMPGEHAVDAIQGRIKPGTPSPPIETVILGEHTLFVIREQGTIRMQRRCYVNSTDCGAYFSHGIRL